MDGWKDEQEHLTVRNSQQYLCVDSLSNFNSTMTDVDCSISIVDINHHSKLHNTPAHSVLQWHKSQATFLPSVFLQVKIVLQLSDMVDIPMPSTNFIVSKITMITFSHKTRCGNNAVLSKLNYLIKCQHFQFSLLYLCTLLQPFCHFQNATVIQCFAGQAHLWFRKKRYQIDNI